MYQRALAIREKALGPDHPHVAASLNDLARTYQTLGAYAKAESIYERALAIQEKALGPDHPDVAQSLNNLAGLYYAQGEYGKAEPLCERALAIQERALGPDHPDVATTLTNLGMVRVAMHLPEPGFSLLQRALRIEDEVIDQIFSMASEQGKFAYLRTIAPTYDMFQSLVLGELSADPATVRAALNAALRRKGAVLDALAQERRALLAATEPEAVETARKFQEVASHLASLTLAGAGELSTDVYRARLAALATEKEHLEKALARQSTAYAAGQRSRTANVEKVAQMLPSSSALVEYVLFDAFNFHTRETENRWAPARYVAFVLPATATEPVLVDLGEAEPIDQAVHEFRQEVADAAQTIALAGEAEAEHRLAAKGKSVYQLAIAPLRAAIRANKELYLAPEGELNLIPFGVLQDEEGRYLIETHKLNYVSSGRDLLRYNETEATGSGTVLLGDPDYDGDRPEAEAESELDKPDNPRSRDLRSATWPALPGTRREVEALAAILGSDSVGLYLGAQAKEDTVKQVKSPRILHLATHGFFLEEQDKSTWREGVIRGFSDSGLSLRVPESIENPLLRSGLVFAGANQLGRQDALEGGEDGILTALEVSSIPLWGTDLVVMSACQTGVGETRRGEGVFGLRRAFQLAGARTVVMSLWSVPDEETATLMGDFYRRMAAGEGKSRSLQNAMLAQMRSRREQHGAAHPFYWGAFVSVGER